MIGSAPTSSGSRTKTKRMHAPIEKPAKQHRLALHFAVRASRTLLVPPSQPDAPIAERREEEEQRQQQQAVGANISMPSQKLGGVVTRHQEAPSSPIKSLHVLLPLTRLKMILTGKRVEITGLSSRADLNNTYGTCTQWLADKERYAVLLEDESTLAIKPSEPHRRRRRGPHAGPHHRGRRRAQRGIRICVPKQENNRQGDRVAARLVPRSSRRPITRWPST